MKLGPVTKLDKRNKTTSKKVDDNIMPKNCAAIVVFPIYSQFGAIRKPDSGLISCKTYIFIKTTFYLTKTANRTKNPLTQLSHYCFDHAVSLIFV